MLLAINENIIDKATPDIVKANNKTFRNVDLTAQQFADHIKKGHAFCAQHKDGGRKSANFTVSGIIAVDIDQGLTVQDALDDEFVQSYASILYTTPSHAEGFPRFRIVFELEVPITDAKKMKDALTGLIQRFGGDEACSDACHMFYGSTNSDPTLIGRQLPQQQVDELIVMADESRGKVWYAGDHVERRNVRSHLTLEKGMQIRLESGHMVSLRDIPVHTRVYCPRHVDRKASAFTLRSTSGNPGVYCSACHATYFLESAWKPRQEYNFDYTWDRILKLPIDDSMWAEDESKVRTVSEIHGGTIRVINSRYLKYDELDVSTEGKYLVPDAIGAASDIRESNPDAGRLLPSYRANFIKSPKGTGKTEWLRALLESHKAKGVSVLLIGHRRSLISTSAMRLGMVSYLGEGKNGNIPRSEYNPPATHYAICVDSLATRLDTEIHRYDLILIDEAEQVFSHLLSDTMKDSRRQILHALKFYLNKAKSVYLLDADLNRTTVQIVDAMLTGEVQWQAIVNQWMPHNRTVLLYKSEQHLVGELVESLEQGKRCFVCANSKKKVEELVKEMSSRFGDSKRFASITGDNSDTAEAQKIIRNIKTSILEYDALFVSPAIGTGIDITFDNDEQHIDSVFGIFNARTNTHFDIDQQLARVRNPKRVCVWISGEQFNFETDANVIKAELQSSADTFVGIDEDTGKRQYRSDPLYEAIFSSVTAMQRASKNKILKNFRELKESNGWTIEDVEKNEDLALAGKGVLDRGKVLLKQEMIDGILAAEPIGPGRYKNLRNRRASNQSVAVADAFKMRRYELESFYRKEVTPELLELDNERKFRDCVTEFESIYLPEEKLRNSAARDERDGLLIGDRANLAQRRMLYLKLFGAAGILTADNRFDMNREIEGSSLTEFVAECRARKAEIERSFDIPIRANLSANAVQQLGALLKKVGLSLSKVKTSTVNGKKMYKYALNPTDLAKVHAMYEWRADDLRWTAWKEKLEERDDDFEILKSKFL